MSSTSATTVPDDLPDWALPTEWLIDLSAGPKVAHVVWIVDPDVPLPDDVRAVLEARNIANFTGQCPECSAQAVKPSRRRRRAAAAAGITLRTMISHEDECPTVREDVPVWTHYPNHPKVRAFLAGLAVA